MWGYDATSVQLYTMTGMWMRLLREGQKKAQAYSSIGWKQQKLFQWRDVDQTPVHGSESNE